MGRRISKSFLDSKTSENLQSVSYRLHCAKIMWRWQDAELCQSKTQLLADFLLLSVRDSVIANI